jgi:prepilin-type N-terminal cleavage/methylation domain-containing protein
MIKHRTYHPHDRQSLSRGFTIVELLIVIVVIAILATIVIVAYNGIQSRAQTATLMSDLTGDANQLKIDQTIYGSFPATTDAANGGQGLKTSPGVTLRYTVNNTTLPQTFCLAAYNSTTIYSLTESSIATAGSCVNLALGASSPNFRLTDGNTASYPYYGPGAGLASVTVDLGSASDVSMVKVWHYYDDKRTYYATKTEVSTDNASWTTVFDSATSGTYVETTDGKTSSFPMRKVRYIRDWLNGSTSNTGDHWVEIQAY